MDSVFFIDPVEILAKYNFQKEQAGMIEISVDTVVLSSQQHLNLSGLISANTNLYIKDYGRGALSTVSFRGTAPSHTQVTWNGMNINSPMLGMIDFSLIPVFIIDELRIQNGAASFSSQSGGLGGLVAIENKVAWTNKMNGELYLDYGSFNTSNLYARMELGTNSFQSKTRIYSNNSLNNYKFLNTSIIETDQNTGEFYHPLQENNDAAYGKKGIMQEFYYRSSERSTLSNRTWMQDASRSIPTVLSNEFSDENFKRSNKQFDKTFKNVTEFNHYWENSKFLVRSGIDFQQIDYSMVYESPEIRNIVANSKSTMSSWLNSLEFKHEFSKHVSVEIKNSVNQYAIKTMDSITSAGYDTTRLESSLFGGLYYSPVKKIQVSVQFREELVSGKRTPFIFTGGINYKPFNNQDIILKWNAAKNYHHPTLNDLFWQPGGNPDLLSEKGISTEFAAVFSRKASNFSFQGTASTYYSKINNWIIWLPVFKGYWEPLNVKEVRTYGMEYSISTHYQLNKTTFHLHGNFALTNTINYGISGEITNDSYGKQLPYIPKLSGNLFFSVKKNGYYTIVQNNSMGKRYLLSSNMNGPEDNSAELFGIPKADNLYTLYPHYLNKLTIGKTINFSQSNLTFELYIDNLFNETYRNILQGTMPGRSYNFHVVYDF